MIFGALNHEINLRFMDLRFITAATRPPRILALNVMLIVLLFSVKAQQDTVKYDIVDSYDALLALVTK